MMTAMPRSDAASNLFRQQQPKRSLIADVLALVTQPVTFFRDLTRYPARHTPLLAIVILVIIALNAIQMSSVDNAINPDMGTPIFDGPPPGDGMPFDPGLPPDMAGGGAAVGADVAALWMTGLTAASKQIIQWSVLALLLAEVTMFNGKRPQWNRNLHIVIWASVPLALMAVLQLIFIAGGGTLTAPGFAGFLSEWSAFATSNIYAQSFIHALASQLTLFWLWSLWLVALGARLTLRGKRPVVLMVVIMWVTLLGLAYAFQSYETLQTAAPDEIISGEPLPLEEMPIEMPSESSDMTIIGDESPPQSPPVEQHESAPESP